MSGSTHREFGPISIFTIILAGIWFLSCQNISARPGILESEERPASIHHMDNYTIERWLSDDGLPQNSVPSIFQSEDGYIWFTTLEGLVRFDGINFRVYDKNSNPELRNNRLLFIAPSQKPGFWVTAEDGGIYHFQNHTFTDYRQYQPSQEGYIQALSESSDGALWLGASTGGLYRFHNKKMEQIGGDSVSALYLRDIETNVGSGGNAVLAATNKGLLKVIKLAQGDWQTELLGSGLRVTTIEKSDHGYWIGTADQLYTYKDGSLLPVKGSTLPDVYFWSLMEDGRGNVWIGTNGNGLYQYTKTGQVTQFNKPDGLSSNAIWSLFEDREGNIWVGSNGGGLNCLRPGKFSNISAEEGLSHPFVWALTEAEDGSIWAGTYDGVSRITQNGVQVFGRSEGLLNTFIWSVLEDGDGGIWAGTNEGGAYYMAKTASSFKPYSPLRGRVTRAVYEDSRGKIYFGTLNGVYIADSYQDNNPQNISKVDGLPNNHVMTIYEDSRNRVWYGTKGGVSVMEYPEDPLDKTLAGESRKALTGTAVRAIAEYPQDVFWFATEGSGLIRFEDGQSFAYDESDGLLSSFQSAVLVDSLGYLWLSTNKGINRIAVDELERFRKESRSSDEPKKLQGKIFTDSDGMKSSECNGGGMPTSLYHSSGMLWFPTVNGITGIDPKSYRRNELPPSMDIQKVLVDYEEYAFEEELILPSEANRVEFHYTGLSFSAPQKMKFEVKLEGYDDEWIAVDNQRWVSYTNLEPGNYTFRVKAANSDGVWNEEGAALATTIQPYFYETDWFKLILAALIIVIGFGAYTVRTKRLRKHQKTLADMVRNRTRELIAQRNRAEKAMKDLESANQELKNLNETKTEFLRIAAHDLRNPLNSIMGFAEILEEEDSTEEEVRFIAGSIYNTSENMLHMLNKLLGETALEQKNIEMAPEAMDLSDMAWSLMAREHAPSRKKKQQIFLSTDENCTVKVDPFWIRQAMMNLLSNAIKYSPYDSNIWIEVRKRKGKVQFRVRDQGPGIPEDEKDKLFKMFQTLSNKPTGGETSTGIGLAITRRIVDLHEGEIWAENLPEGGSRFIIELQLYQDEETPQFQQKA